MNQATVFSLFMKLQESSVKDISNLHPYPWLVKKSETNWICFILARPGYSESLEAENDC